MYPRHITPHLEAALQYTPVILLNGARQTGKSTLPQVADSLAGRMEILSLWPLSQAEMGGDAVFNRVDWLFDGDISGRRLPPCDRADLTERLLKGGFPVRNP